MRNRKTGFSRGMKSESFACNMNYSAVMGKSFTDFKSYPSTIITDKKYVHHCRSTFSFSNLPYSEIAFALLLHLFPASGKFLKIFICNNSKMNPGTSKAAALYRLRLKKFILVYFSEQNSTFLPSRIMLVVRTAHIFPHMEQVCLSEGGVLS